MLMISRRENEGVVINDAIQITVVEVKGGRVKLGFEYPEGNTVYRKELFVKIQEENQAAAHGVGKLDQLIASLTTPEKSSKMRSVTGTGVATEKAETKPEEKESSR